MKHLKTLSFITLLLLAPLLLASQHLQQELNNLEKEKTALQNSIASIDEQIEEAKLKIIQQELLDFGIPKVETDETLITHSCMVLVYAEDHEQAKWVSHVITPDIITGRGFRSNDFRPDPKVTSGTAIEKDYFLKYPKANGDFEYDGFGYDRGHLAPSADFRWSEKALSESYFYSNMAPQRPEFNREIWADLENNIRGYIYKNPESKLYVTTGGILKEGLPVIEKSINKVSIPEAFFKVIVDPLKNTGIGFIIPNKGTNQPLETFALTIDEVEKITGFDFFQGMPDTQENKIETTIDKSNWIPELQDGNVESLTLDNVPRKKSYPATFGEKFKGTETTINICGTVVGGRYSRKGNLLLNIDKKFPNQIFTVFVKKERLINFSYDPITLIGSQICSKGTVQSIGQTPTMFIKNEKKIEIITQPPNNTNSSKNNKTK